LPGHDVRGRLLLASGDDLLAATACTETLQIRCPGTSPVTGISSSRRSARQSLALSRRSAVVRCPANRRSRCASRARVTRRAASRRRRPRRATRAEARARARCPTAAPPARRATTTRRGRSRATHSSSDRNLTEDVVRTVSPERLTGGAQRMRARLTRAIAGASSGVADRTSTEAVFGAGGTSARVWAPDGTSQTPGISFWRSPGPSC
jgi:hypothetical protein